MQPRISKRLRLPPIIEAHSQALPANDSTRERHHLWTALSRVYRPHAGGVVLVVGWTLRNGGGGVVWPSVLKRYEGVGGCQIYGKKALRNTWMAPYECVRFNVISVTRGVGAGPIARKKALRNTWMDPNRDNNPNCNPHPIPNPNH